MKKVKFSDIKTPSELNNRIQIKGNEKILSFGNQGNRGSFSQWLNESGNQEDKVIVNYSSMYGTHSIIRYFNLAKIEKELLMKKAGIKLKKRSHKAL
nr:hypothetical protein [Limnohabitans sp. T6-5]